MPETETNPLVVYLYTISTGFLFAKEMVTMQETFDQVITCIHNAIIL